MSFTTAQKKRIIEEANKLGVEGAALLAFCEVESNSTVFTKIDGKDMPLIRWEGHYFYKLVPASKLDKAIALGLASKKAGAVKNPTKQVGRYAMLEQGKKIDYTAAVSSCSWGFGQVMGSHFAALGYGSALNFERSVCSGFDGQLQAMTRFLDVNGVIPHLKRKDWSAVARIYNGPNYAKDGYHTKMKTAYERQAGKTTEQPKSANMLRSGSKGQDVRELQMLLRKAGYDIKVDGDYGPATIRAVEAFQTANKLEADGVAGPKTMLALVPYKDGNDNLGKSVALKVKEVREGGIGMAVAAGGVALKDDLTNAANSFLSVDSAFMQGIGNTLTGVALLVGVGFGAYALYGYIKSKRTYRGIEQNA